MSRYQSILFTDALPGDALIDQRVIDTVSAVKSRTAPGSGTIPLASPVASHLASHLERARAIYRSRRARNRHFDPSLFAEPSWDILLDLFIADETGKSVGVSSACIGAAAPHATALRHLGLMQRKGLVERRAHPRDARCQQVSITTSAATSMRDLFASLT